MIVIDPDVTGRAVPADALEMRAIALLFDARRFGPPPWPLHGAVRVIRRLSDMPDYFAADTKALTENPVIYEVYDWPARAGLPTDLMITMTAIHPGTVGGLPFHTKGHFHKDPDGAELVVGVSGEGRLELVDRVNHCQTIELAPGACIAVEPGWAHRVVNTGAEPLCYLSVSSASIGHDYEGVRAAGWMPGSGRADAPTGSQQRS